MGCGASTGTPPADEPSAMPPDPMDVKASSVAPAPDANALSVATGVSPETNPANNRRTSDGPPEEEPQEEAAPGPDEEPQPEEEEEEVPTHEQSEALFDAIGDGDLHQMQSLIESGVPLNVRDEDGNTPLHKACEGETECARSLLLHASNLERKNAEGETALMTAIRYEDATIVEMLKQAGAKVTPAALKLAREFDVPEVIRCLTGEDVADRIVKQRSADEETRRVSVSGENIKEFTGAFTNEKEVRRASLQGAENTADANLAAMLVPEKPDEDDEEEPPPP
jgi:hypothetical protein